MNTSSLKSTLAYDRDAHRLFLNFSRYLRELVTTYLQYHHGHGDRISMTQVHAALAWAQGEMRRDHEASISPDRHEAISQSINAGSEVRLEEFRNELLGDR